MKVVDINKIYIELVKQALKDGVITEEENQILAAANTQLREFKRVFDIAGEDGIITSEEKSELQQSMRDAVAKVRVVGLEDGVLTMDEDALLKTLNDLMSREIERSIDVRRSFSAVVDI